MAVKLIMFYKTELQRRLFLSSSVLQIASNLCMTALFESFTVHFETAKVGSYLWHSVHSTFMEISVIWWVHKNTDSCTQLQRYICSMFQELSGIRKATSFTLAKKGTERNSSAAPTYLVCIFENQYVKLQAHPRCGRVQ